MGPAFLWQRDRGISFGIPKGLFRTKMFGSSTWKRSLFCLPLATLPPKKRMQKVTNLEIIGETSSNYHPPNMFHLFPELSIRQNLLDPRSPKCFGRATSSGCSAEHQERKRSRDARHLRIAARFYLGGATEWGL